MNLSALLPRYRPVLWLLGVFLVTALATRVALLAATPAALAAPLFDVLLAFLAGTGYDLLTFVYFSWPLVLLLWILPRRWADARIGRWSVAALCLALLFVLLFVAVAEWTFWEEFQARFNFIAVDYLVYTTEVLGNIRESYPVGLILSAIAAVGTGIFLASGKLRQMSRGEAGFGRRAAVPLLWAVVTVAGTAAVSADLKGHSANTYVNELSGNGIYQFFAAYRNASLDYERYYAREPLEQAFQTVRSELQTPDATFTAASGIERQIQAAQPERKHNVVLISIESLSAEYSGLFGRSPSLTPKLDALASESLLFTDLYATGTRTVRGLEALSLSVPPTPGESIVKRQNNEHLFSLASVFDAHGYESMFLYGGYGAFDNMNAFFGSNGYTVHDRRDIPDDQIHHENVWGVADEDLYGMALHQFDVSFAKKQPFFAHLMTTSNHRPYTFPEGRGPWPQGKRESAVSYTDWAVADFLERAKSKPWFKDTVFVITADHCASSGGLASLPVFRYHIPLWIYSPGNVAPGRYTKMLSQIDIPPTLLGLLGTSYRSQFYGVDVLNNASAPERAFVGTYQLLGYLRDNQLVELSPNQGIRTVRPDYRHDAPQPEVPNNAALTGQAVGFYQTAAWRFTQGQMRLQQ